MSAGQVKVLSTCEQAQPLDDQRANHDSEMMVARGRMTWRKEII